MKVYENYQLKDRNTFHVDVIAKEFVLLESKDDVKQIDWNKKNYLLGKGASTLFTDDFDGIVASFVDKPYAIEKISDDEVYVTVFAGNSWIQFVDDMIDQEFWGVENLISIPGSIGAAPVQNIGAYGVDLRDVMVELSAFDKQTRKMVTMDSKTANLGYRSSLFKDDEPGRYVIIDVTFKLSRIEKPKYNYTSVNKELELQGIKTPTSKQVAEIIKKVRTSKLPDPNMLGNNGSFFKNPVVSEQKLKDLKSKYPEIVSFDAEDGKKKIPAGWLIESAGWKGRRDGNVGVYDKHALVLVNYGNATGKEVWDFSQKIIEDIKDKFGVELVCEGEILH